MRNHGGIQRTSRIDSCCQLSINAFLQCNDCYAHFQHVSMYHRNQIHTDEFWRYELTKNRRTVMDDKANEDLWKKQLGKHAEETARQKLEAENAAAALASLGSARSITEPEEGM